MTRHIAAVFLLAAASLSAQIKISEMPAASTLTGAEKFQVTQSSASKAATVEQVKTYITNSLGGTYAPLNNPTFTGSSGSIPVVLTRISLASTTTYYLTAKSTFSAGSAAAFGKIIARRRR